MGAIVMVFPGGHGSPGQTLGYAADPEKTKLDELKSSEGLDEEGLEELLRAHSSGAPELSRPELAVTNLDVDPTDTDAVLSEFTSNLDHFGWEGKVEFRHLLTSYAEETSQILTNDQKRQHIQNLMADACPGHPYVAYTHLLSGRENPLTGIKILVEKNEHGHIVVGILSFSGDRLDTQNLLQRLRAANDKSLLSMGIEPVKSRSHIPWKRLSVPEKKALDAGNPYDKTICRDLIKQTLELLAGQGEPQGSMRESTPEIGTSRPKEPQGETTQAKTYYEIARELKPHGIDMLRFGNQGSLVYRYTSPKSGKSYYFGASDFGCAAELAGLRAIIDKGFDAGTKWIEALPKHEDFMALNLEAAALNQIEYQRISKDNSTYQDEAMTTLMNRGVNKTPAEEKELKTILTRKDRNEMVSRINSARLDLINGGKPGSSDAMKRWNSVLTKHMLSYDASTKTYSFIDRKAGSFTEKTLPQQLSFDRIRIWAQGRLSGKDKDVAHSATDLSKKPIIPPQTIK